MDAGQGDPRSADERAKRLNDLAHPRQRAGEIALGIAQIVSSHSTRSTLPPALAVYLASELNAEAVALFTLTRGERQSRPHLQLQTATMSQFASPDTNLDTNLDTSPDVSLDAVPDASLRRLKIAAYRALAAHQLVIRLQGGEAMRQGSNAYSVAIPLGDVRPWAACAMTLRGQQGAAPHERAKVVALLAPALAAAMRSTLVLDETPPV